MDKKKIKRIIVREGLILLCSIIFAFGLDSAITYIPEVNTVIVHTKAIVIFTACIYILLFFSIRFILWALRTLRKKEIKKQ